MITPKVTEIRRPLEAVTPDHFVVWQPSPPRSTAREAELSTPTATIGRRTRRGARERPPAIRRAERVAPARWARARA